MRGYFDHLAPDVLKQSVGILWPLYKPVKFFYRHVVGANSHPPSSKTLDQTAQLLVTDRLVQDQVRQIIRLIGHVRVGADHNHGHAG